jgi:hypothetical protein
MRAFCRTRRFASPPLQVAERRHACKSPRRAECLWKYLQYFHIPLVERYCGYGGRRCLSARHGSSAPAAIASASAHADAAPSSSSARHFKTKSLGGFEARACGFFAP